MVEDTSGFPELIPECNTSYLLEKNVPPPSEKVLLAFAAMGASLLIQDTDSDVRNRYSNTVYRKLEKTLRDTFEAKKLTRELFRVTIRTWIQNTFSPQMFELNSGNLIVAFEKRGSRYTMAVKHSYQDGFYPFVVSTKMDIGYAIGKLLLVPFFKDESVRNVFLGCFDSFDAIDMLPYVVNFAIMTKTGAEEIFRMFTKVLARCSWNSNADIRSSDLFQLPDFFMMVKGLTYFYANPSSDTNRCLRVCDGNEATEIEGCLQPSLGEFTEDVDEEVFETVNKCTLRIIMMIIEICMRVPAKPENTMRDIPKVYIVFWTDNKEDLKIWSDAIRVLIRFHGGEVGQRTMQHLINKAITYSSHNLLGAPSEAEVSQPKKARLRDSAGRIDIPFMHKSTNPLHIAFALCSTKPTILWNGRPSAVKERNTIVVKCIHSRSVNPTMLIKCIEDLKENLADNIVAFSSVMNSIGSVSDMDKVVRMLGRLLPFDEVCPPPQGSQDGHNDSSEDENEEGEEQVPTPCNSSPVQYYDDSWIVTSPKTTPNPDGCSKALSPPSSPPSPPLAAATTTEVSVRETTDQQQEEDKEAEQKEIDKRISSSAPSSSDEDEEEKGGKTTNC